MPHAHAQSSAALQKGEVKETKDAKDGKQADAKTETKAEVKSETKVRDASHFASCSPCVAG